MDNEGVRSKLLLPPGRLLRLGASQMLANSYASVISRRLGFANEASLRAGAGSTFSACKSNHAGTSAGVVEYHRAPEHVSHVADLQGPQPPFFFLRFCTRACWLVKIEVRRCKRASETPSAGPFWTSKLLQGLGRHFLRSDPLRLPPRVAMRRATLIARSGFEGCDNEVQVWSSETCIADSNRRLHSPRGTHHFPVRHRAICSSASSVRAF